MPLHPTAGPGGLFALAVRGAESDSLLSEAAAALWRAAGLEATALYLCLWDATVFPLQEPGDSRFVVGPTLFCPSLGYGEGDIAEIHELAVGDTWTSGDYGHFHTVRRIR